MEANGKLLIVDDEPRMCESLKAVLAGDHYDINTATSGRSAVAMLTAKKFDLVLMDYVIPDISGPRLMKQTRELNPEAALIVMTGYASVDKAVDALRLGAFDFLQKPFDCDELRAVIRRALQPGPRKLTSSNQAQSASPLSPVPAQTFVGDLASGTPEPKGTEIGSVVQDAFCVTGDTPIDDIKAVLKRDEPVSSVVVIEERRPIGLVMSIHLDHALSHPYGISLYSSRPVRALMDKYPLVLEYDTEIAEAARLAMMRPAQNLYDHLVITKDGEVLGTVSVRTMLQTLNRLQGERSCQLEHAYASLQRALEKVKKLSGLVPICAQCKKIRDDQGYWNQIEAFIEAHSDAEFSHSICPECVALLYPGLDLSRP
ncbi:MAG: response regulator [Pseudomonadota bacterium]